MDIPLLLAPPPLSDEAATAIHEFLSQFLCAFEHHYHRQIRYPDLADEDPFRDDALNPRDLPDDGPL